MEPLHQAPAVISNCIYDKLCEIMMPFSETKFDMGITLTPGMTQTHSAYVLICSMHLELQYIQKCWFVTIGIFVSNFFQSQTPFVPTEIVPRRKYFTPLISGFIWSKLSSSNSSILSKGPL